MMNFSANMLSGW